MKRVVAALVVLAAAAVPTALPRSEAADVAQRLPAFHPMDCPGPIAPPDRPVDCGYVVVPENRRHPEGRTIRVAAAVVHSADPTPRPDPIVFMNGGPSVMTIQGFAMFAYFAGASFAEHRDIVLIDTRGVGISRPRLGCPELDRADPVAAYSGRFVYDRAPSITGRALDHCWDRLTAKGIDLASYDSREGAADVEAIREALGYDQWNLVALSADGTIGMNYLRRYPDSIRSAVFDAPVTANAEHGLDFFRGQVALVRHLFAECRARAMCREAYPGFERAFFRTVDRLNQHPALVTLPAFQPHPVTLLIDGTGLINDLNWSTWPGGPGSASTIPVQLKDFWAITHGRLAGVYRRYLGTGPFENPHNDDYSADGKTMSVACHDFLPFVTEDDRREFAQEVPEFAQRVLGRQFDLGLGWNNWASPEGCEHWPVGKAPRRQQWVVNSNVPTLVLSGTYDAAVAPVVVERMLPGLTNATYVEMPTSGHVILGAFTRAHWCSREITRHFLASPQDAPDTSCIGDIKPLYFGPPRGHQQRASVSCPPSRWTGSAPYSRAWACRQSGR
ncbi:alpha/beta hydrolase [Nocardioides humilatus]|uniref:Alpha/beta hydrolase n=1 Tax=Nocardioides humilatus TaxID=2607660 RepID=A0A5B1LE36_9ACTN|nr:alpha/beta fold hydrolase [Nocardioides humilatus]KAA1418564.1 alpha/beta hydrolase [Nocardioides humilatus]